MTRRFIFSFPSVAEDNRATDGTNRIGTEFRYKKLAETALTRSTINRLLHEA